MIRRAFADVFALGVYTESVLAGLWTLALVHVRAIASGTVQFVTVVAIASEHSEYVLTATENAQVIEYHTFVYVDAGLLVILVGMHKSHDALAPEGTRVIKAVPVLAQSRIVGALVHILARITVAPESSVANTLRNQSLGVTN